MCMKMISAAFSRQTDQVSLTHCPVFPGMRTAQQGVKLRGIVFTFFLQLLFDRTCE